MNKINTHALRKWQQFFLNMIFAAIGCVLLLMLLDAAEVYAFMAPDSLELIRPLAGAVLAGAGIPYLLLGAVIVLAGGPNLDHVTENPFASQERLEIHFKKKLDERNYSAPVTLMGDAGVRLTVRSRKAGDGVRLFAVLRATALEPDAMARVRVLLESQLRREGKEAKRTWLTLLLCVDQAPESFGESVRHFGEDLPAVVVPVGFDFGQGTMSFWGKMDGLAAGSRKRALRAFVCLLPDPQRHLDLKYPAKMQRKRYPVILPFDPVRIPKGIRSIWAFSSLGLAVIGFGIGVLFVQSGLYVAATLTFIYGFVMLGVSARFARRKA